MFCTQERKDKGDAATATLVGLEAGRITVLVWLAHLMAPLVQLLSVVILYQITDQSSWFLLMWVALWGLPIVYVWRFSNAVREAAAADAPPPVKTIGKIFAAYVLTFVIGNISLLYSLGALTSSYNVAYFFTLTLGSAFALATLSFVALNSEFEADRAVMRADLADREAAAAAAAQGNGDGAADVDAAVGDGQDEGLPPAAAAAPEPVGTAETEDAPPPLQTVNFCSNCGTRIGRAIRFCPSCGCQVQVPVALASDPTTATAAAAGRGALGDGAGGLDAGTERAVSEGPRSPGGNVIRTLQSIQVVRDPQLKSAAQALWAFLSEKEEQLRPGFYGKRLPYRRLFLLVAVGCLGAYLFTNWKAHQAQTPEQAVQAMLFAADPGLMWPSNGTALDNLLTSFQTARDASDDLCLVSWGLLLASVFVEPLMEPGKGLAVAQAMSSLSMVMLFVGLTIPAYPNYVKEIHIHDIIPRCAPEFDDFVDHLIRNGVGLLCSGYFAAALFVVLLAISPALVRVSKMMALDGNLKSWKTFHSDIELRIFKRNVLVILAWGSLLAPLLCALPMLIFFQFLGDLETGLCFISFTMLPIIAAFTAKSTTVKRSYFLYLVRLSSRVSAWAHADCRLLLLLQGFYFLPLLVVLLIESKKHHLSGVIINALSDPMVRRCPSHTHPSHAPLSPPV